MTQLIPTRGQTVAQLFSKLLDRGYTQATRQALAAVARSTETGLLSQRLGELDAEAQRLAVAGLSLTADNAVLRAALSDFETVLSRDGMLIRAAGEDVQNTA